MSGTFVINKKSVWMVPADVHDGTLKRMADALSAEDSDLRTLLMDGRMDRGVGYCDLGKLDNVQFAKLVRAAHAAHVQLVSAGPQAFALPKYYPGYVKQVENLLDMLNSDPRRGKAP